MKWNHIAVEAEMGVKEGLPCALCSKMVTDLIFYPHNFDEFNKMLLETDLLSGIEVLTMIIMQTIIHVRTANTKLMKC